MKNRIFIILIITIGMFIILNSIRTFSGRYITPKEVSCERIQNENADSKVLSTIAIHEIYTEQRQKGLINSVLYFLLGSFTLLIGVVLANKIYYSKVALKTKLFELALNLLYWAIFVCVVGYFFWGMHSCSIDWIYIFLVAGLTGFYASYLIAYPKIVLNNKVLYTLKVSVLFSFLGIVLSYMPVAIASAFKSGNYKPLFSISMILILGFFGFLSFINFYIGMFIKKQMIKMRK